MTELALKYQKSQHIRGTKIDHSQLYSRRLLSVTSELELLLSLRKLIRNAAS